MPTYLVRQQGFSFMNAGIFAALPLLVALITLILVGGIISDYLVKFFSPLSLRRNLYCVGMILASTMLFTTAYSPDPYTAVIALSLAGAGLGFSTPSLWVALVEATPKGMTGAMGGIQNIGGNLAGIVVAVSTGYLLERTGSFFMTLLAGSIVVSLGAVAAFSLIRQNTKV
jgi:MFS family permease